MYRLKQHFSSCIAMYMFMALYLAVASCRAFITYCLCGLTMSKGLMRFLGSVESHLEINYGWEITFMSDRPEIEIQWISWILSGFHWHWDGFEIQFPLESELLPQWICATEFKGFLEEIVEIADDSHEMPYGDIVLKATHAVGEAEKALSNRWVRQEIFLMLLCIVQSNLTKAHCFRPSALIVLTYKSCIEIL